MYHCLNPSPVPASIKAINLSYQKARWSGAELLQFSSHPRHWSLHPYRPSIFGVHTSRKPLKINQSVAINRYAPRNHLTSFGHISWNCKSPGFRWVVWSFSVGQRMSVPNHIQFLVVIGSRGERPCIFPFLTPGSYRPKTTMYPLVENPFLIWPEFYGCYHQNTRIATSSKGPLFYYLSFNLSHLRITLASIAIKLLLYQII